MLDLSLFWGAGEGEETWRVYRGALSSFLLLLFLFLFLFPCQSDGTEAHKPWSVTFSTWSPE